MKMGLRSIGNIGLVILIIFCIPFLGCETFKLPPPLSPAEQSKIRSVGVTQLVVGVEKYRASVYSDELIRALRRTELFSLVDYVQKLDRKPDLIVQLNQDFYDDSLDPFTGMLIGYGILFPVYSAHYHYGFDIDLWVVLHPERKNKVVTTYANKALGGWITCAYIGFMNLSPNWTCRDPKKAGRFLVHFKLDLIKALNELGLIH